MSYDDVARRWLDVAFGRTTKPLHSSRSSRVWASGDVIYSYGTHFPMANIIRNAKSEPTLILVNGDTFSVTTSKHQGIVRNAIGRESIPNVIIPFTVLDAAGIDWRTIEVVERQGDRFETIYHSEPCPPRGAFWHHFDHKVDKSDEEIAELLAGRNAEQQRRYLKDLDAVHKDLYETHVRRSWYRPAKDWADGNLARPAPSTRNDLGEYDTTKWVPTGERELRYYNRAVDIIEQEDGSNLYEWETSRHWLGGSLIKAKVRWSGNTTCKACKGTGRNPSLEHLWLSDRNAFWDRTDWSCAECDGRRSKRWTRSRTAYFLSSFDEQETRPSYFFCELPKVVKPPTCIADAYEILKPEAVKLAEDMGRSITRQGDIFSVEMRTATKRQLRKDGARFEKMGGLLGTSHCATEVAYMPNGMTLARGVLTHKPPFRRPDHIRQPMGNRKAWHLVCKNTVPQAR